MSFPTELVPDGTVAAIHHLYSGVALAVLLARTTWDDDVGDWADGIRARGLRTDPFGVVAASIVALGLFALAWPHYPVFGAAGTLAGLAAATVSLARPYWRDYRYRAAGVAVGLAVAWDDAVSHAFGVVTPLDWTWTHHIYPHMA